MRRVSRVVSLVVSTLLISQCAAPFVQAQTSASSVAAANLVGEWLFEESSGDALDTSTTAATGTVAGGISRSSGISGHALVLNGSDASVSIPNTAYKWKAQT